MVQLTKEESKAITITKVLCMFGVIYIHAAIKMYVDCPDAVDTYYDFFTRVLTSFAVPGFFMCSGFLLFMNYRGFESYAGKLKSRFHSLAVPYIFWITLTLLVSWCLQDVLGLAKLFGAGNMKLVHDFSLKDFVLAYWNLRDGTSPFLSTMWFMRDLMVCVVMTPILFLLLKHGKKSLMVILALLALSVMNFSCGNIASSSVLYFAIGGGFSINNLKPFSFVVRYRKWIYTITVISTICYAFIYTDETEDINRWTKLITVVYNIMMLLSVIGISMDIEGKKTGKALIMLGVPSFFIYLAHEPYMGYLLQIMLKVTKQIPVLYNVAVALIPVLYPLCIIGMFYLVFRILRKYTPGLLSFAVGGKV